MSVKSADYVEGCGRIRFSLFPGRPHANLHPVHGNLRLVGDGSFHDNHETGGNWGLADKIQNGTGAAGAEGGANSFEISHPLGSGDPSDFSLSAGDRPGFCLRCFKDNVASDATTYPSGCVLTSGGPSVYDVLEIL